MTSMNHQMIIYGTINEPHLNGSLDVMQSHPLHRMCFGQ